MKGISLDVIRLGKKYKLTNFGDVSEFEVVEFLERDNFRLKDLNTLEYYELQQLVMFGKGEDFAIEEI